MHRKENGKTQAMSRTLEAIKHHFEGDRFATINGMRLLELRPGYAKTSMAVEDRHLNSVGTVHGGAIFTLADFAFGAAVKTGGKVAPLINSSISFLKATRTGTLTAEATEVSRSRKIVRLHGASDQRRRGIGGVVSGNRLREG